MTYIKGCACGCGRPTNTDQKGNKNRYVHGHNRSGQGKGWMEQGYRYVSIDGKKRAYHRWVMEQKLGRRLTSAEIVHHVDENPLNNHPDNLIVLTRAEHARLHRIGVKGGRSTPEERGRVIELRGSGMTNQQIARASGRPYVTVTRWLSQAA